MLKQFYFILIVSAFCTNKAFSQFTMSAKTAAKLIRESKRASNGEIDSIRQISVYDAYKHLGEMVDVSGFIYAGKVERNTVTPNSVFEVLHMGDAVHPVKDFIILMRMKKLKGNIAKIQDHVESFWKGAFGAIGRVFLYNGVPAIMIDEDDLGGMNLKG